jgi:hypothetical protein
MRCKISIVLPIAMPKRRRRPERHSAHRNLSAAHLFAAARDYLQLPATRYKSIQRCMQREQFAA